MARIGVQVAAALAYAHGQGILHRDIKPSNLLLDLHGTVWVTDFGLAKAATDGDDLTHTGDLVGTVRYMAPERFQGQSDARGDVYGLGLTLYELLVLRPAFVAADRNRLMHQITHDEPPRPRRLQPGVPRDLETIVLKAMAKEPAHRYPTAAALAEDLKRFVEDRPIRARRVSLRERFGRWCRRNPALASVTAALVLVLLAGIAVVTWKWQDERAARADADVARRQADERAAELQRGVEHLSAAHSLMRSARLHAEDGEWRAAEADYYQAALLRPDHSWLRTELGFFYGRLYLFDLAADQLVQAFAFEEPAITVDWLFHAQLRAWVGDHAGYQDVCRRQFARFGQSGNWLFCLDTARACLVAPDCGVESARVLRLAERGGSLATTAKRQQPWHRYVRGIALYRDGQYARAAQVLQEASADPTWGERAICFPVLAMAHYPLGRHAEARLALQTGGQALDGWTQQLFVKPPGALPIHWADWIECLLYDREAKGLIDGAAPPEDPRLRIVRGRAFAALGRPDQADAEYARAVELAPDAPQIRFTCFRIHVEQGRWDQAETEFAKVADMRPNDAQVHVDAFRVYADKGQWDRAAAELTKAVQLKPEDPKIVLERFRYHLQRGEPDQAEVAYAKVRDYRPDDEAFHSGCGQVCAELGQWDKARAEYGKAIELGTPDGEVWNKYAVLQVHLGDRPGYHRTCELLLERHGETTDSITASRLVFTCTLAPDAVRDPQRLVRLAEKVAAAWGPSNPNVPYRLGAALFRAGQFGTAVQQLTECHSRTGWGTVQLFLALAYHRAGRRDHARSELEKIGKWYNQASPENSQDSSTDPNAWYYLLLHQLLYREAEAVIQPQRWRQAEACVKNRQWAEAVRHLDHLLAADNTYWRDWTARGRCYAELGQWDQATADYTEALRRGGDDMFDVWYPYAVLCLKAGRREEYRRVCARLLERFERPDVPVNFWAVIICKLAPQAVDDPGRVVKLAAKLNNPGILGHCLYRNGRYEEAARQLEEGVKSDKGIGIHWTKLFLALACEQLGRQEEARRLLGEATQWIKQNADALVWAQREDIRMLHDEAEGLIRKGQAAPPKE